MSIILDLIISYPTYFFLNVLNSKRLNIIILYGLIIDFIINYSYGIVTIILIILYYLKRYIKNYYLYNIICFIIFYMIFNMVMHIGYNTFLISLFMQIIFIILNKKHIIKW